MLFYKKIKPAITILLMLVITGCTTTKTVYIPCAKPNLPPKPIYATDSLKPGDSASTVAKAYVASLHVCRADNARVRYVCGEYK